MTHDETVKDPGTTTTGYEQRIDEAAGIKVGPPDTGERDQDAIDKGDERWEQTQGSH